jgi:integrase
VAGVASYYAWEEERGLRKDVPTRKLKLPGVKDQPRDLLTRRQIRELFAACSDLPEPWTPELGRAVLSLVAGAGFRASEVAPLQLRDVSLAEQTLRIRQQKGKGESYLPIAESFRPFHEAWQARRAELVHGWPVKPAEYLLYAPERPLGKEAVYTLLRRLLKLAGLGDVGRVTPHALRHHFITCCYIAGGLEDARLNARHKQANTTLRYIHLDAERLRASAEAAGQSIFTDTPIRPYRAILPFAAEDLAPLGLDGVMVGYQVPDKDAGPIPR